MTTQSEQSAVNSEQQAEAVLRPNPPELVARFAQPGPISDDFVLWARGEWGAEEFAAAVKASFGLEIEPDWVSWALRVEEEVDWYT